MAANDKMSAFEDSPTKNVDGGRVAIVIVFYENSADTVRCIASLEFLDYPTYDVILVNNGSSEPESHQVRKWLTENIPSNCIRIVDFEPRSQRGTRPLARSGSQPVFHLVELGSNQGFAEGCNLGIVYALNSISPDYVLVLNNDAVVSPTLLLELINFAKEHPETGVIGATILTYDHSRVNSAGSALSLRAGGWEKRFDLGRIYSTMLHTPRFVDKVEGSCMLVPRTVLSEVGLFDPSYFLYWEDVDFCFRVREAGYSVANIPTATVRHRVSATSQMHKGLKEYYMQRNRLLFLRRHASALQFVLGFPATIIASLRTLFTSVSESATISGNLAAFAKGWIDGLLSPMASPPTLASYFGDQGPIAT